MLCRVVPKFAIGRVFVGCSEGLYNAKSVHIPRFIQ